MDLAILMGRLIQHVIAAIVEAYEAKDFETLKKVQDFLPPGDPSALDVVRAMKREEMRCELEEQE